MKKLLVFPFLLSACLAEPVAGTIVDYNGSSVRVSTPGTSALMRPMPDTIALARTACPEARYVSTQRAGSYNVVFLFLCD